MAEPGPLDGIAYLTIRLYGGGEMSISGNIHDKQLALGMLDHARDTIKNRQLTRTETELLTPSRDIVITPQAAFPLTQYADVAPNLRPIGPIVL